MRKNFLLILLIALSIVCATHANAAAQVEVSPSADYNLGTWNMGDSAISSYTDICIYSGGNTPAGSYAITITSSNGAFYLANGSQHIPYALYWENSGASHLGTNSPGTLLTYGSKLTGQANADTGSATCTLGTAETARLTLKIAQTDMQSALAGTYTDKIYIILSPT